MESFHQLSQTNTLQITNKVSIVMNVNNNSIIYVFFLKQTNEPMNVIIFLDMKSCGLKMKTTF